MLYYIVSPGTAATTLMSCHFQVIASKLLRSSSGGTGGASRSASTNTSEPAHPLFNLLSEPFPVSPRRLLKSYQGYTGQNPSRK
mmetsp:Transcript_21392/g.59492  ORF Transcript_21392/g.59492 Transcript_21392/m.59492 type:complete len:84 (-) Transcript_21392:1832-2083(-)